MKRPQWLLLFSAAVLGGVALLAGTHPEQTRAFWNSLKSLSPASVAGAFLLILVQVSAQALRMWAIIPRAASVSVIRAGYTFTVGDWTNIFVPARGGDGLKVLLLHRGEHGRRMPLAQAAGAMLADKVVDIGTLIFLCAIAGLTSLLMARTRAVLPPPWVLAVAVGGLVLLLIGLRQVAPTWLATARAGWRGLLTGLSALKDPGRCLASVSFSVVARLTEMLAMGFICGALGFSLSLPQLLLALLIVNLSTSVPISIASLGVYEAGLAYGLTRSDVPLPVAITIATTHHALELLGITLSAAGYALAVQARRRSGAAANTSATSGP